VLEQACVQINQWRVKSPADLRVAVNLSARHLRHRDLPRFVDASISRSGIPPSCLEVEITESSVMEDVEQAVRILNELAEIGVQIAIDDFGTGYSSLGYIKRFPIDRIKIDRMFIKDLTTCRDDAAIVKAIIALAHGLDVRTVAEGVETAEQLGFLREHGCDEAQGYHFSRPVPAAEVGAYRRRLAERG
jgi:EAL domain-containing protein (putative c-di-GMP-specific phosphodiesterase class I)